MSNHSGSSIVSLLLVFIIIGGCSLLKNELAATKTGTIVAGGFGSLVFLFLLTAISNLEMSSYGSQEKAGFTEAFFSLIVALIFSASVHRVSLTVCLIFSLFFLYILSRISIARYNRPNRSVPVLTNRKKK